MTKQLCRTISWLIGVVLLLSFRPAFAQQQPITFQYFYDERGQLVKVVDSTGNVIEYVYDPVGNMLEIKRSSVAGVAIFSFTPQQGVVGATVTIQGQGFSPVPTENIVQFNGNAATVTAATNSTLIVTVPPGATTGPITVTVGGQSATTDRPFTVAQAPVISAIQPKLAFSGQLIGNFQVTGQNLLGASFAFTSTTSSPLFNLTSAVINQAGTAATLVVQPGTNTVGDFVLIATSTAGNSSPTPTTVNTLVVLRSTADADSDGLTNDQELLRGVDPFNPDTDQDGFSDGDEVRFGSNPLDPNSLPVALELPGEVIGSIITVVNITDPTAPVPANEAVGTIVTLVNTTDPSALTPINETTGPILTVENPLAP